MGKKKLEAFLPDRIEKGMPVTRAVLQLLRSFEGQQVEICIRAKRWYTTDPQRRYYRGVVIPFVAERMRDDGWVGPFKGPITDEEVHEILGTMFLRFSVCVNPNSGETLDKKLSTTELTITEMSAYIENIKTWADQQWGRHVHHDDGTSTYVPFEIPEAEQQQRMFGR